MDDSSGVIDSFDHALNCDERAALAAWAEDDAPDGFADAVLTAWVADAEPAARPRRELRPPAKRRGALGIGTAVAAAAAVLLMVRIMPEPHDKAGAGGCEHAPVALADVDSTEHLELGPGAPTVLGADAVAVLTRHCTPCHDGTDPRSEAKALEVFDLQQPRWWSMADDQLREASLRIEELGSATDDERRSMAAFVDAELSRRGGGSDLARAGLRDG